MQLTTLVVGRLDLTSMLALPVGVVWSAEHISLQTFGSSGLLFDDSFSQVDMHVNISRDKRTVFQVPSGRTQEVVDQVDKHKLLPAELCQYSQAHRSTRQLTLSVRVKRGA